VFDDLELKARHFQIFEEKEQYNLKEKEQYDHLKEKEQY